MNKQDRKKKVIKELCLSSGMQPIEFQKEVEKAMNEDCYDYPDRGTIYRWYNGDTLPRDKKCFIYIAKALGLTLNELNAKIESDEIAEYRRLLDAKEEESLTIKRIVWLDSEGLILLAFMLIEYGSLYTNVTYWQSGLLYLISIVALFVTIRSFNKKFPDPDKGKGLVEKTKSDIDFIRRLIELSKQRSPLYGILTTYIFILVLVMFIPVIETWFYKGSFKITTVVFAFTALSMMIRGLSNR